MRHRQSDYMQWAKTQSRARFNLATSGVGAFPLSGLGGLPPLEINGDNSYGYAPLKAAIAARHQIDPACVVTAAGTSGANYLAFATLVEDGDEVVLEHPTYGLLEDALLSLGASVNRFTRARESDYALDPSRGAPRGQPENEAHRRHQPAQSVKRAHRRERTARDRRNRAICRRARARGRGLPGRSLRKHTAHVVPPRPGIRSDQQSDQDVRRQRTALRLDSRRARFVARHVAYERCDGGDPGPPRRTAERRRPAESGAACATATAAS